ncbi:MAG: DNA polymerase III [Candidatus Brennerbacteria bacterium]|nr:DNA polymerase III [Candidatus Brennerbacteria bacterium]
MKNSEIAKILYEIGEYLEMQDDVFKPRAYQKAAGVIEELSESVEEIYKQGGLKALEKLPGIGVSIAEKIEELIKTGRIKYYYELKKKTPVNLSELSAVEGLGPKHIKKLYQELKIKNLKELEKAVKAGKIRKLEGFGEKSEQNILKSIEFLKRSSGRFILGFVMPFILDIEQRLKNLKEVKKIIIAGSTRRRKETIGDVDILVAIDENQPAFAKTSADAKALADRSAGKIMDFFVNMPEVASISAHGETKSAVKLNNGMDMDLRVVPEKSFGAALNYFTGSKNHNVALREIAIKKGYKLNEYGLFFAKGASASGGKKIENGEWKQIAGRTEEDLYKALGMDYIEPEMRENLGEIELALRHGSGQTLRHGSGQTLRQAQGKLPGLPKLIGYSDLRGDLQVQSNWTDGAHSIEEMAEAAMRQGLQYIAITDHTKRLAMTGGLDEKKIVNQWKEIDKLNLKFKKQNLNFRILKGTECDILKNGTLDLPDKILSQLDIVGVSVHSYFNLSREDQTERIKKAMVNPNVDILFHPTGRIIQKREAYEIDIDEIIKTAKKTGTILEIDAYPSRLDLNDEYIKKCVEAGVKMSIDSDAHSITHFPYLEFGIAQARRGWAKKSDIINGWPLEKMLKLIKR